MAELSPMMKQYIATKANYNDAILFYRLGDFYEMFFEDAIIASRELELTLTGRECGLEERAPMCGVPFHSCEGYIARLVSKGYKVAICEQMEDPATAKGIVQRDVIRVITPGTVIESSMLDENRNNYICSLYVGENKTGICFCDISTGELNATIIDAAQCAASVKNEMSRFMPKEILIGGEINQLSGIAVFIKERLSASIEMLEDECFAYPLCSDTVIDQFKASSISALQLDGYNEVVSALGALINYLKETQMNGLERITDINIYNENQFMSLDYNTKRNLELTETMRSKEKRGSLLWVLDKTKTAMGKRLIRSWIEQPLSNLASITRRQNAVDELVENTVKRCEIIDCLAGIFDIERLMTRIVYGSANGRELRTLCAAAEKLPDIKALLKDSSCKLLSEIYNSIDVLDDVRNLINIAIVEEPPFSVREGGIIKKGYNQELDFLSGDMSSGQEILSKIESEEREKTGIPKLKVGYNRVFGYYIEVTNSYKSLVPDTYIRKQTLTNCERYITEDLKALEGRILGAKERATQLEYKLFEEVRTLVAEQLERIQTTARAIAQLDCLCSLATVASENKYCCPNVNLSGKLILKDSRHPVVEKLLKDTPFVPNDVNLDTNENRVAIITGPNMAGKSTYMRQTALIVLMAQIGSFVPAASAEIGIVDSIFTRVGASDDLSSGQSTFMVEMNEVAHILKNATSNSLLILDEIGRGTSTFDGMSIARAVLEYVADKKKLGAKTMFATHYHELTVMEDLLSGVKNYNIAVKKHGEDISFLRRIVPGGADDSYGIDVARLAGIPDWVINRAKQILAELEGENKSSNAEIPVKKSSVRTKPTETMQLTLTQSTDNAVRDRLKNIDVNTLTPIEALNILFELKKLTDNN
ncbi:MAG: DNA mismatch repair protein MutS [Acutalibacteraceae bacterium]